MGRSQTYQQALLENTVVGPALGIQQTKGSLSRVTTHGRSSSDRMSNIHEPLDLCTPGPSRKRWKGESNPTDGEATDSHNKEIKSAAEIKSSYGQDVERIPSNQASMNCNSNGKTDIQELYHAPETARFLQNYSFLRKVKHINMGEVPLHPMGLSLSGSGMQLFVRMDDAVQQEIMNQCAPKKKGKESRKKAKLTKKAAQTKHQISTQAIKTQLPYARPKKMEPSKNVPSTEEICTFSETQLSQHMKERSEEFNDFSNNGDGGSRISRHDTPFDKRFYECPLARHQPQKHHDSASQFNTYVCLQDHTVAEAFHRISQQKHEDEYVMIYQSHSPTTSNNLNDNEASTNTMETECTQPTDRTGYCGKHISPKRDVQFNTSKMKHAPVRGFTSRDLPLKRIKSPHYCVMNDKTSQDSFEEESKPNCSRRIAKNKNFFQSRLRTGLPTHRVRHVRNMDEDDNSPHASDDDIKIVSFNDGFLGKNNSRRSDYDTHEDSVIIKKETLAASPTKSVSVGSAVGPMFDTTSIPPHALDAHTLEKFTQYTKNMRNELRDSFKNLSVLMKDINHIVIERNKPEMSQGSGSEMTTSNVDERRVKLSDGKVCAIM